MKIKIEIIIALTNSISIADVLISLESLFALAKTIIWALLTQVWIVLMELDIDLSIVTNKVLCKVKQKEMSLEFFIKYFFHTYSANIF